MMANTQIKRFGCELGFTWKNALLWAVLGIALGVVCAFAIPIRVS